MSRASRKSHQPVDDAASIRPAMADLHIAPIRSSADYHEAPRSVYSTLTVLPPLRTLEPPARFNTSARPAALEPPRDPQHSSYASTTFQQSRRSAKSSRHQQQQPPQQQQQHHQQQHDSSRHRSRKGDSVSSSSSVPSSSTSPRHLAGDPRYSGRSYTHEPREEDAGSLHDFPWRERPPTAGSTYSPEQGPYPTPVRSTAGCSDLSSEPYASPSSIMQSPAVAPYRTNPSQWTLQIRQQPRAARACGFGERDRRVIDPPPVVQLESVDSRGRPLDVSEIVNTFTVVHVSLWDEEGTEDRTSSVQPGRRPGGRLMGTLVASATIALDEHDDEGVFFAFPDLSCRSYGKYRLRFALMAIDPLSAQLGNTAPVITHVTSDVFEVYSAKDFPGMRPSTALTQALKRQGTAIPVKKGKQASSSRSERDDPDEDDDDD